MAEKDSLSGFDFNKVSKPSKYLKFEAGKPVTVRILTKDPVVQTREFTNKKTGEVNIATRFCFIVWNFTDELAQILSASPSMAKTFQRIGTDPDFGENLQECDIKISPEGEMLDRVYDINVLRHSGSQQPIIQNMVTEAKMIDLDRDITDGNQGRLSEYDPGALDGKKSKPSDKMPQTTADDAAAGNKSDDVEIEDMTDEPIDLSEIPF